MKFRNLLGVTALTLCVCASAASAAPTYYTNQAAFLAASGGGLGFESYENAPGTFSPTYVFSGFTVSETNGVNALTNVAINGAFGSTPVTDGVNAIWYDDNGGSLSNFFSFSSGVNAFGLDLTTSSASTVTITGQGWNTSIILAANTPTFFGVIDTGVTNFAPIQFDASGGPLVGFDATYYGTAVPEPSTFFMLGGVLLGLAGVGLRRRKN